MNSPGGSTPADPEHRTLLLLWVAVSLALMGILLPFYSTLLWSGIIALLFAPLHRRLQQRLGHRRTLASLLTILVAVVIVVVPFAVLSVMLAHEAAGLLARLQSGEFDPSTYLRGVFDALPGWAVKLLQHFGLSDFDTLQLRLGTRLEQFGGFVATQALSLGQGTFEFAASLLITPYLSFFLIRDGDRIVCAMRQAIPLKPAHKQELLQTFSHVIRATVKGNLAVAAIQGALGGLAFWFFGVRGALLWGVVMAFLSLLPAVGAALVWLPLVVWFLLTGSIWQGLVLAVWGVLVIGLVDNLLRPMLVGKATLLPDYVIMITTLGGLVVFGVNGFVIGPAIAAMFFAVWHLYLLTRPAEVPAASSQRPETPD
jgi:predicted PurR-regulated permease PerM